MALHIEVYAELAQEARGGMAPVPGRLVQLPTPVTIQGSSTQSSELSAQATFVCLTGSADCHVAMGLDPTATTGSILLPANTPRFFKVRGGDKVACIQTS